MGDVSRAVGFCQDFLTDYPNIKAVYGPDNASTIGFVTGLTEKNRTDIVMVGFGASEEMVSMIRSGEYNVASVVQHQYLMGYDAVEIAFSLANGGEMTEKVVETGIVLVDKNNIDTEEVQNIIF